MTQRVAFALAAVLVSIGISAATLLNPADAAESSSGGFITSAVSPSQITVGQSATLTASVRSDTSRRALVDVEVYDSAGRKVFQKYWDWQRFTARSPRTYKATWSTTGLAPGSYTVGIGVFRPQWRR